MKVIEGPEAIQGSDAWLARREGTRNASEAPVVMGVSPYTTRDQLLAQKATGIKPEVTSVQQAVYDEGHRVEPLLRAMCEGLIGDELSPLCADSDDGYLSASFDGVTFDGTKLFEAKQSNQSKLLAIREQRIPDGDYWQCVQQFAVCETAQILYYYCGDGEPTRTAYYTQQRTPQVEADIIKLRAAWAQFDKDLAAYQPPEPTAPAAIGHAPETLPALAVTITGAVTASNLPEFKERSLWLIRNVKTELATDQDFADAEQTVKWCAEIEKRIATVKQAALAQTTSIDELFRTMDAISDEARRVRLQLSKSVKSEKDARKTAITAAAIKEVQAHVNAQNQRCTFNAITYDGGRFATAIKGMSSLANMQSALNDVVAAIKIETSAEADRIAANVATLDANKDHAALFPDWKALALKQADDLAAVIAARIAQAKEAEAKRLEAERERIRQEEAAKARAAAEAETKARAANTQNAQEGVDPQTVAQVRGGEPIGAPTPGSFAGLENREGPIAETLLFDEAPKPVIAIGGPFTVDTPAAIPSNSAELERPTLTLGAINERLAPIRIDGAGIASFGIEALATEKRAKLYSEGQLYRLTSAMHRKLSDMLAQMDYEFEAQTEKEAA